LRRVPGNEIGADYSGQPPNCNVALPLELGWIQPFPGPFAVPGEGCGIAAFGPSANALAVAPAFHRPAARGVARTPGNPNSTPAETGKRGMGKPAAGQGRPRPTPPEQAPPPAADIDRTRRRRADIRAPRGRP